MNKTLRLTLLCLIAMLYGGATWAAVSLTNYTIVNEDDDELVPEEGWTNAITNGNLASSDVSCYI